jgi:hypothetical protein
MSEKPARAGTMSNKRRASPLPHTRRIEPHPDTHWIYYESRGIRTVRLDGKPEDTPEFMRRTRYLCTVADRLLERAGEKTPSQLLREASQDSAVVLVAWTAMIGARYGVLSPVYLAAQYLGILQVTTETIVNDTNTTLEKLTQVAALCEAWHWFHMEVYGEHKDAFQGKRTQENLAASSRARSDKKEKRKEIIAFWCDEHWRRKPRHSRNATQTALALLNDINAALRRDGHRTYKAESLEIVIREIIQERDRAA